MKLLLPQVTFLSGPPALARGLALKLSAAQDYICPMSLEAPLDEALRGLLWGGNPDVIIDKAVHIPELHGAMSGSVEAVKLLLHATLESKWAGILGRLAVRQMNELGFPAYIFDDLHSDYERDAAYIAAAVGNENCLLINLRTDSLPQRAIDLPSFRTIELPITTVSTVDTVYPSLMAKLKEQTDAPHR